MRSRKPYTHTHTILRVKYFSTALFNMMPFPYWQKDSRVASAVCVHRLYPMLPPPVCLCLCGEATEELEGEKKNGSPTTASSSVGRNITPPTTTTTTTIIPSLWGGCPSEAASSRTRARVRAPSTGVCFAAGRTRKKATTLLVVVRQ